MHKNIFEQIYRQVICQMNGQVVLPGDPEGNQHNINENDTILNDYPVFASLNGDLIAWAVDVLNYPFYFKAETVSNITLKNILFSIITEADSFWSLLSDLEKDEYKLTELLSKYHRQFSSIKLQLDLVMNGECLEKYKNTEYDWERFDFRADTSLINQIMSAKEAKDTKLLVTLLNELIDNTSSEKVIIPKKNQLSSDDLNDIGTANEANNNILTIEQFNIIKQHNQFVADKAFEPQNNQEAIREIIRNKPNIQLAAKSTDTNQNTLVPTVGLLLTYCEKNHTRDQCINKKDGTQVYYKIVFPYLFYQDNWYNHLPVVKDAKKIYVNAFRAFNGINILVQENDGFTSHELGELWNFNGKYQKRLYPDLLASTEFTPKYISAIINEDADEIDPEEENE